MSLPSPIQSSIENDFEKLLELKEIYVELEELGKELENKWGIKKETK